MYNCAYTAFISVVFPFQALISTEHKETECVPVVYYSETPPRWTPWGPGEVSCIERCPHFRGIFTLRKHCWLSILNTKVSFQGCPLRGVPQYIQWHNS